LFAEANCGAWRWGGRDHVSVFLPTHRAGPEGGQAPIRLKIWKVVRQVLLALVEVRNERPWWTRLVASGDPGRVLVGVDGSPESAAATTAALELLGDRVGRLTLVAVTDLDDSYAGREERVRLQGELERQAEAVRAWLPELDGPAQAKQTVVPELQLMAGRPATTLDTIAAEDGYDLLVVGARGTGMSSVLLRQRGDQPRRPGQRAGADRRRPGREGPGRAQAALSRPSRPAALTTRRTCFLHLRTGDGITVTSGSPNLGGAGRAWLRV